MAVFDAIDTLNVNAVTVVNEHDVAVAEWGAITDQDSLAGGQCGDHAQAVNDRETPSHASIVPDQPVLVPPCQMLGNLEEAVVR